MGKGKPAYPGPPAFVDQPLGQDEQTEVADRPEDEEGYAVGGDCAGEQPHVIPAGQRFGWDKISDVPGAEGLLPFSSTPGVPPQVVVPYPYRIPSCEVTQKGGRIFSQWSARTRAGTFPSGTPPEWESYRLARSPKVPGGGSALWSVDIWAYERIRYVDVGPVEPLPRAELVHEGGASPATTPGTHSSRLKARLMWWSSSGGETRIVDIAQGVRCCVEAQLLTVEVMWPSPGTQDVDRDRKTPLTLAPNGGIVLDTEMGCAITPTWSTPGKQILTNTMIVEVPAGEADLPVLIPPGALSVTAYQSQAGALMIPTWRFGRSVADPGAELGALVLAANRRVQVLNRPGPAGMLLTGPSDAQNERLITFIFELEI